MSLLLAITWPFGLALFILWTVVAALSLFAVITPLLIPLGTAIRGYANLHRRYASRVLGQPVIRGNVARAPGRTLFGKFTAPLRDPMTWREWAWLLVNSVAGFVLALLPIVLLATAVFCLAFPLIYAITPPTFEVVFGAWQVRTQNDAWLIAPLAALFAALWWVSARSFPAADATLVRALIGAREDRV